MSLRQTITFHENIFTIKKKKLTCCIKASKLPVNTMDVQLSSNFFSFFCSSIGSQWARRLGLHFTGLDITIKCDRIPPSFCIVRRLLHYTPLNPWEKKQLSKSLIDVLLLLTLKKNWVTLSDISTAVLKILCKVRR